MKEEGKQARGGKPSSLAEIISSLPEEERIILTLHYLRSLTVAQIAELLKVPEKSVVVVIAAGKARLTSHLGL